MDVPGTGETGLSKQADLPHLGSWFSDETERFRLRKEIIAASGADTEEHFNKVEAFNHGMTFRKQAEWWLNHAQTRKRRPIKPATALGFKSYLNKWLNPNLGDLPAIVSKQPRRTRRGEKMTKGGHFAKDGQQRDSGRQDGRGFRRQREWRRSPSEKVEPRIHRLARGQRSTAAGPLQRNNEGNCSRFRGTRTYALRITRRHRIAVWGSVRTRDR